MFVWVGVCVLVCESVCLFTWACERVFMTVWVGVCVLLCESVCMFAWVCESVFMIAWVGVCELLCESVCMFAWVCESVFMIVWVCVFMWVRVRACLCGDCEQVQRNDKIRAQAEQLQKGLLRKRR